MGLCWFHWPGWYQCHTGDILNIVTVIISILTVQFAHGMKICFLSFATYICKMVSHSTTATGLAPGWALLFDWRMLGFTIYNYIGFGLLFASWVDMLADSLGIFSNVGQLLWHSQSRKYRLRYSSVGMMLPRSYDTYQCTSLEKVFGLAIVAFELAVFGLRGRFYLLTGCLSSNHKNYMFWQVSLALQYMRRWVHWAAGSCN